MNQSHVENSSFAERCRNKHLLFVTGKLAQSSVREIVDALAKRYEFTYEVVVLPITVAALMTAKWLRRNLQVEAVYDFIVLPGYLQDDLDDIQSITASEVIVGPKDIRDLGTLFGQQPRVADYGDYQIEIIAEINYAGRLQVDELVAEALKLKAAGADMIDLGCDPGKTWKNVGQAVQKLRENNIRCSIDSFDTWEVTQAVAHGAELVLSVNELNCSLACDWNAEVVVIPAPNSDWLASLHKSINELDRRGKRYRIDPILDPIGCGFLNSLGRYQRARQEFPEAKMMMGIGNITELTDVDSAGLNVMLLAVCEELQVGSILTTQVINWARSSVAECDVARRLVHYAQKNSLPPKRIDPRLVMLRDPKLKYFSATSIADLAAGIKDNNYRILVDAAQIHILAANVHIRGTDPFLMMDELMQLPESRNIDASHAFYLGFELSKAATALQLGKQYEQDVALQWGLLTQDEKVHRLRRGKRTS